MKMNNHGQTLVLFIIFIPILLMLCAFVIDTGIVFRENSKLSSTSKIIMQEAMEKNLTEESIKELFSENDIPTENIIIKREKGQISIKIDYQIDSVFGAMIGIKDYEVKLSATLKKEQETYLFQKD